MLTQHIQENLQVTPGPFPNFLGWGLGTKLQLQMPYQLPASHVICDILHKVIGWGVCPGHNGIAYWYVSSRCTLLYGAGTYDGLVAAATATLCC